MFDRDLFSETCRRERNGNVGGFSENAPQKTYVDIKVTKNAPGRYSYGSRPYVEKTGSGVKLL